MVPNPKQMNLFEQGQPLVRSIAFAAMRRLPVRVELDDLIGYGQLGLAEAAMKYQENSGTRFTTFAYYRIKGAIYDGVSKMSWTSRARMNRLRLQREEANSHEPAGARDSLETNGRTDPIRLAERPTAGETSDHELEIEDWAPSPASLVANREIASKLEEFVQSLPRLPRTLIRSIYYDGESLQSAANRLGISKSWASRVHAHTLQQLALSLRKVGAD